MVDDPLFISPGVRLRINDMEMQAIRAQGPGGQHVNKTSSAIHLRFDIRSSSLPEFYQEKLLSLSDHRITRKGIIIIKADRYRVQEQNRADAIERLCAMIRQAGQVQKKRKPTKPTKGSKLRRLDSKTKRGKTKVMRGKVGDQDGL